MTLGTPGQPSDTGRTAGGPFVIHNVESVVRPGEPFNACTNLAINSGGRVYVADGYGNCRIHAFSRTVSCSRPGARSASAPVSSTCRTASPSAPTTGCTSATGRTTASRSSIPTAGTSPSGPTCSGPATSPSTPTVTRTWRSCGGPRARAPSPADSCARTTRAASPSSTATARSWPGGARAPSAGPRRATSSPRTASRSTPAATCTSCEVSYTFGARQNGVDPAEAAAHQIQKFMCGRRHRPAARTTPYHGGTARNRSGGTMRHSTERIRTTHGGNLPRPAGVRRAAAAGPGRDRRGRGASCLARCSGWSTRQLDCGVDVVNDGEYVKAAGGGSTPATSTSGSPAGRCSRSTRPSRASAAGVGGARAPRCSPASTSRACGCRARAARCGPASSSRACPPERTTGAGLRPARSPTPGTTPSRPTSTR